MRLFYELIKKRYDENSIYEMGFVRMVEARAGMSIGVGKLAEISWKAIFNFILNYSVISITHFFNLISFLCARKKCILFKKKYFKCNEMKIGYLFAHGEHNRTYLIGKQKKYINQKINIFSSKSVHINPSKITNTFRKILWRIIL